MKYISLILFIFLFSFGCVHSQTFSEYVTWTVNQHSYVKVTTAAVVAQTEAVSNCSNMVYNGQQGYLVTITSADEWAYIISKNLTNTASWISGSDYDKLGSWVYHTGPEVGIPLYELYFDKCYEMCAFAVIEPNLLANEHWLHTSGTAAFPYWNNNNNNANGLQSYICEFGGLSAPVIESTPTVGGNITIRNLEAYDLPTLDVTFTSKSDGSTFKCVTITKLSSSSVSCQIAPNTGKYTVVFKDKTTKTYTLGDYHFNLPFISSVYPSFTNGQIVTVTGTGFGTVASKITIFASQDNIPCTSVTILRSDEALTCTLTADISGTLKFLPITINVNGQGYESYKAAFFNPSNKLFYSGFISASNFDLTKNGYANHLKLDGYTGSMGYISSAALYNFILQCLPDDMGLSTWNIWQPYYYNGSNFILNDGINSGSVTTPYSTAAIDVSNATLTTRFYMTLKTGVVTNQLETLQGSTLAQYGGQPNFITVKTHNVSTSGGKVNLQIDNYGTVFSVIQVLYSYQSSVLILPYTRDYINSLLVVDVPTGYNGPYSISVTVDTFTTTVAQFIKYLNPVISQISIPSTNGGVVTITGENFYTDSSLISIQGLTCTGISMVTPNTAIACTVPAGSGKLPVTITVGTLVSESYIFQYSAPSVASVSNISPLGGSITIQGNNFFNLASLISISIGSFGNCANAKVETPHTKISCIAPPGYNKQPVVVTINGLVSNNDIYLFYDSPTISNIYQIDDYLVVNGTNFGTSLNGLTTKLSGVDITQKCLQGSSDSSFICKSLPNTVVSGDFSISGSNIVPSFPVLLIPYLVSISQALIPTSGSQVSISGRFFESGIIIGGNSSLNFNKVNNQLLVVTIPSGTGLHYYVRVSNNNGSQSSVGTLEYSYQPPIISTTIQNENILTVYGQNFGNLLNKISMSIGSIDIDSSFISYKTSHTELEIQLQDDLKNAPIQILVDSQPASFSNFKLKPYLTEATSPSVDGGDFNIYGYFLSETNDLGNSTNIEFEFNTISTQCQFIQGPSPYEYTCNIKSGFGSIISSVTVDNIQSDSFEFYYASPRITGVVQIDDYLQLEGIEFGIDFNDLTIYINQVDITSGCTGNSTQGTCKDLPMNVQSGNITIVGGNAGTSSMEIIFKPYLLQLSVATDIDTKGQEITISGRFFESLTLGEENIIFILQNNIIQEESSFVLLNNSHIIYNVSSGVGSGNEIKVQINENSRLSNSLLFSFKKPIITSIQQVNDTLEIVGSYFGNDLDFVVIENYNTPSYVQDDKIVLPISPNTKNGELKAKVSNQISNSMSYILTPLITESTGNIGVRGGIITLSGKYLSDVDSNGTSLGMSYNIIKNDISRGISCTFKSSALICNINITITGDFDIQSSYGNVKSNVFELSVQPPTISISTSSKKGTPSEITIVGNNFENVGLNVTVENKQLNESSACLSPVAQSSTVLVCQYSSDIKVSNENGFTLPLTIRVSVDGKNGENDVFNYLSESKTCSSQCVSPFGICKEGICECLEGYTDLNCQILKNETTSIPETPSTGDNGTSTLPGGNGIEYQIAITHLREIDSLNQNSIVKTLKTSDIKWDKPVEISSTKKYYLGRFENDPAQLELYVSYFESSTNIEFAGEPIQMPDKSIKYEIHVSKWNFARSLNTLQVIYLSTSPSSFTYSECETKNTTTSVDENSESLGWFEVRNGNSKMMAKFSSKMYVDTRIMNSKVKLLDSATDILYKESPSPSNVQLYVSMNVPFFEHRAILDPNFSTLLFSSSDETIVGCEKKNKWKIPLIAVLCSVGGATAVAIGGILSYKKYQASKLDEKLKSLRTIHLQ